MKKRKNLYLKILGIFFVLIIVFSSVRVVFADQDIAQMLSSWMDNKRIHSINELEKSISLEQANQTARLKSEIKEAINAAEQQHQDFLENEKFKRIQGLKDYADKLIENYDVTVDKGADVTQMLECIAINAEIEMDIVLGLKDKSALKDCGVLENVEYESKVEDSGEKISKKEVKNDKGNDVESEPNSEEKEPEIASEEVQESEGPSNNHEEAKTEGSSNDTEDSAG